MDEQLVASYKEQVFGNTIQSANDTKTDVDPIKVPDIPEIIVPEINIDTTIAVSSEDNTQKSEEQDEIVNADEYLKSTLGFDNWETAKTEVEELRKFKANPTSTELKFENENSKKLFDAIKANKTDDIYEILNTQKRLSDADNMLAKDVIKLHIEQTNKHFKQADVEDVFEEKYAFPSKPIQALDEEDNEYNSRLTTYNNVVEKINRKIDRDAVTAKIELAKLKTELKLPEIPETENPEQENYKTYQANLQIAEQERIVLEESLSKLKEKDISIKLNFNDEASKMKFDIDFQADKDGFSKARDAAYNYTNFLAKNYYKEDGSPIVDKLTKDIYIAQNLDKVITESVKQAVTATKSWFLKNQKNIGDGIQKNYNTLQPDGTQKLREQIFGN